MTAMASGQANAEITKDVGPTLTLLHEAPIVAHSLRAEGFDAGEDGTGRGTPIVPVLSHAPGVDVLQTSEVIGFNGRQVPVSDIGNVGPLDTDGMTQCIATGWSVRRLTPTECERLQGFPDGHTNVPAKGGKPAADGPRYRVLGNSMATNVMQWLGRRIDLVRALDGGDA